ncbi:MAG: NAD+ synthase [Rhodospirillales bacterium CG15_BIG_FIL_POST_REV_8_21_14_020_66_15]|nr:MAG: NAD+ synthase [Rhodospirillales bacterium CG15_BIG_FIL_POST_REV_8_21_14_020_66_15]
MTDSLAIAIAQINPTVGDVAGNLALIRDARAEAAKLGADLVVTGELALSGYPPEDLVLKRTFQDRIEDAVQTLAAETGDGGPAVLTGAPWREKGKLYNAGLLLDGGKVAVVRLKHELPNYGVFDEKRLFAQGPLPGPVPFRGARLGVMVCEDMWFEDVTECLDESGAEMLIVLNGSPYDVEKGDQRLSYAVSRVKESGLPLMYVNLVGGQDELVFDGGSFVLDAGCNLTAKLPCWQSAVTLTQWTRTNGAYAPENSEIVAEPGDLEAIYRAMVLGLRDYVNKNGFPGVVLGLSGGVDSALSAAVAVDALGADRVLTVMMPSPYTSPESLEDAAEAAALLGTRLESVAIAPAMQAFDAMLARLFQGRDKDITEENIQARTRGLLLMALSNKFGHMLLTTGNKSEMSVGYATIYGDMNGGYSVLKDVYKTTVFRLCHWRNQHAPDDFLGPRGRAVPERTITKPPSAELRPGQTDQDSLPPYAELDAILMCLVEKEMGFDATVAEGFDAATVRRIWVLLDRAEYKRRQAPPGVKITGRAFGRDRRYPITNGFTKQFQ